MLENQEIVGRSRGNNKLINPLVAGRGLRPVSLVCLPVLTNMHLGRLVVGITKLSLITGTLSVCVVCMVVLINAGRRTVAILLSMLLARRPVACCMKRRLLVGRTSLQLHLVVRKACLALRLSGTPSLLSAVVRCWWSRVLTNVWIERRLLLIILVGC